MGADLTQISPFVCMFCRCWECCNTIFVFSHFGIYGRTKGGLERFDPWHGCTNDRKCAPIALLWIYSIIEQKWRVQILNSIPILTNCTRLSATLSSPPPPPTMQTRNDSDSQQVLVSHSFEQVENDVDDGLLRARVKRSNAMIIIDRIASCKHFYLPLKIKRSRWPFFFLFKRR